MFSLLFNRQKLKMEAKRQSVLDLFHAQMDVKSICNMLNVSKTMVYHVIRAGTAKRKVRTIVHNRKRTASFVSKVNTLTDANPNESIRNVAKKLKVDEKTIRTTLKTLGKRSVVRPPRHLLTAAQKQVRLDRGKRLLNMLKKTSTSTVKIFSDKKVFTVDQAYNRRNDQQIVSIGSRGEPVSRTKHPASVMFLGIVTSDGKKGPPIFIPDGVKVNTDVYIDILATQVLPWLRKAYPKGNYIFQQDSAPAHASKRTQEWLRLNVSDFWDKNVWPSNSPDLNPLDYSVWGVMEPMACKTSHPSKEALKTAVVRAWRSLKPAYLIKTCRAFRSRLERMIEAEGGLIE